MMIFDTSESDGDELELEANDGEQAAETTDGGPADIIEVDAAECTAETRKHQANHLTYLITLSSSSVIQNLL